MIIRGLAVYAFSFGRKIGVDLEAVRAVPDGDDIEARFSSRRENETYLALDVRDRPLAFFNCWTRKEAFNKALGDGLYYPFDCFHISLTPGEPAKIHRVESAPGDDCGWRLESFTPAPGLVAAVVIESGRRNAFAIAPSRSTWATISRSSACSLRVSMAIASRPRVEELAAYFAAQIRAFRPGGPYIIAGFCTGGTIAFQLGRQLLQERAAISFLALFGSPYPNSYRRPPQLAAANRALGGARRQAHPCAGIALVRETSVVHLRQAAPAKGPSAERRAAPDPVLVLRGKGRAHHDRGGVSLPPSHFAGRLGLFLPCKEWVRSADAPLCWRSMARDTEEYFGPDGCNGDFMLREPYTPKCAELFSQCRERNVTENAP